MNFALFLLQLAIILATSRLVGALVRRIRQPRVIGEIIAGILLGPSLLGWLAPSLSTSLFPKDSLLLLNLASQLGLSSLNNSSGDWPGLGQETQRLNFIIYGLILVAMMLLRPQGILPSRVREQELKHDAVQTEESVVEQAHA